MAMDRRPYPWKLTGDRQTSLPQPSVQDRITHILLLWQGPHYVRFEEKLYIIV